ncbi:hypothetical protein RR48_08646 [Papilio machaon]|uniref:CS domain-containing protein n=1 Tax=Papilio machaon TaxID=76193 RepID=A0A194R862_PAPMA|nr:hypothetical protein RR48_08646 [Papilio machaon]
MEFTHDAMTKLKELLREPEPEVLQGDDLPFSASCENLIVRIKLPGDKKENVELTVDTKSVTIQSPQYYLKLALPHDIDPDNSKANWDSFKESLILTLKLDREFDFVNF